MQPVLVRTPGQSASRSSPASAAGALLSGPGSKPIEVVVKDLAEEDVFEWALIENIQREDLNPIEEAEAYRRLLESAPSLTQEQLVAPGEPRIAPPSPTP